MGPPAGRPDDLPGRGAAASIPITVRDFLAGPDRRAAVHDLHIWAMSTTEPP